jgi:hypothetical protein
VSETDFAELPSGDLVCVNNSIFARPGRQVVHRTNHGFVPGSYELSTTPDRVPETVCLTEGGLLVGCMRGPWYAVSDDEGLTWEPLAGLPPVEEIRGHVYQPYIQYLGRGEVACAGHFGADDPIALKRHANYIMLHRFALQARQPTGAVRIRVSRPYDVDTGRYPNVYLLHLTSGGRPMPGVELAFWYAERWEFEEEVLRRMDEADGPLSELPVGVDDSPPSYDNYGRRTLEERMALGGKTLCLLTDEQGMARVELPHLDRIKYIHHSIRFVVRFNWDGRYPHYRRVQTMQYEFYSVMHWEG